MEIECSISGCTKPAIVVKQGWSLCEKHDKEAIEKNNEINNLMIEIQKATNRLQELGVQIKND